MSLAAAHMSCYNECSEILRERYGRLSDNIRYNRHIQATKEENLERVEQNTEQLHRLLVNSGAEASDMRLLEFPKPPAEFVEQFVDGSYYEGINIHDESANCSAAYLTDPEDVNNEHDSFRFYLEMGEGA